MNQELKKHFIKYIESFGVKTPEQDNFAEFVYWYAQKNQTSGGYGLDKEKLDELVKDFEEKGKEFTLYSDKDKQDQEAKQKQAKFVAESNAKKEAKAKEDKFIKAKETQIDIFELLGE